MAPGAVRLHRSWSVGDRVRLRLPRTTRVTAPDPRVDASRGCVAIERGPEVWCLEGLDLPAGWALDDVVLVAPADDEAEEPRAEIRLRADASATTTVPLRRYREWGQRGLTTMRIWLPTS